MVGQPCTGMETLHGQSQRWWPEGKAAKALQDDQPPHLAPGIPLLGDGVIGSTSTEIGKLYGRDIKELGLPEGERVCVPCDVGGGLAPKVKDRLVGGFRVPSSCNLVPSTIKEQSE